MSETVPPLVLALAREREGYIRAGRADRVIPVDEQILLLGWCVKADGSIVEYKPEPKKKAAAKRAAAPERADQKAPEQAVPPKPAHSEKES